MSRPISRGKRRHLVALMTVEAQQQDHARFMRRICAQAAGTMALPSGAEIEVLTLDSQGGSFEMFQRTVAIVNDEIAHRLGVTS